MKLLIPIIWTFLKLLAGPPFRKAMSIRTPSLAGVLSGQPLSPLLLLPCFHADFGGSLEAVKSSELLKCTLGITSVYNSNISYV